MATATIQSRRRDHTTQSFTAGSASKHWTLSPSPKNLDLSEPSRSFSLRRPAVDTQTPCRTPSSRYSPVATQRRTVNNLPHTPDSAGFEPPRLLFRDLDQYVRLQSQPILIQTDNDFADIRVGILPCLLRNGRVRRSYPLSQLCRLAAADVITPAGTRHTAHDQPLEGQAQASTPRRAPRVKNPTFLYTVAGLLTRPPTCPPHNLPPR